MASRNLDIKENKAAKASSNTGDKGQAREHTTQGDGQIGQAAGGVLWGADV